MPDAKVAGRHISIDLEEIVYTLDSKPARISKVIPSEEWFETFENLWNRLCDLCGMFADEGLVLSIPMSLMQNNAHPVLVELCEHYDTAPWVRDTQRGRRRS